MIRADDGVAGFFEDLPVLMFVLMGVSVLVISGAWVARENCARELERRLDDSAREIAQVVVGSFDTDWGPMPRVSSLTGKNISAQIDFEADGHGYAVVIACLYPGTFVLACETAEHVGTAYRTGFARELFNAVDDQGVVRILEVRVIVWEKT